MEDRTSVLATSLTVENFASLFLGYLLDIPDPVNATSLNGRGAALSFSQKINLLIDIGALNSSDRAAFHLFMEIRNLFMHNFLAHTYFRCYELLLPTSRNGLRNRYYPDKPRTAQLTPAEAKAGIIKLSSDVLELTRGLVAKMKDKAADKAGVELMGKYKDASIEVVAEVKKFLTEYVNGLIKIGDNIDPNELKDLGDFVSNFYYKMIFERMGWSMKKEKSDNEHG